MQCPRRDWGGYVLGLRITREGVDDALQCWCARQQKSSSELQTPSHSAPPSVISVCGPQDGTISCSFPHFGECAGPNPRRSALISFPGGGSWRSWCSRRAWCLLSCTAVGRQLRRCGAVRGWKARGWISRRLSRVFLRLLWKHLTDGDGALRPASNFPIQVFQILHCHALSASHGSVVRVTLHLTCFNAGYLGSADLKPNLVSIARRHI